MSNEIHKNLKITSEANAQPVYVSLISLNSKTIDIAALGQTITAPIQDDSHIVKTELIHLGKDEFKTLFFSNDGEHFSLNQQINENTNSDVNHKEFNDAILFNKRFKMTDSDFEHIEPLILSEHLFSCYEKDTGIDRDCWETCCVMDMQRLLTSIKSLSDMGVGNNVLSSLKWSEIENIIKNDNTNYYNNPVHQSKNIKIESGLPRHILQISAVFKSSSPDIKDCIIIFRYAVDIRDSTIDSNKYFRFGNPEYLLDKFQLKVNEENIDIDFKSDIFRYDVEIFSNNTFDISVNPVIFINNVYDFLEKHTQQPLSIDIYWFNDKNTTNSNENTYHALAHFNEKNAKLNNYKQLTEHNENLQPSYSNNSSKPILRINVRNSNDDNGNTLSTYEIHFTIKN